MDESPRNRLIVALDFGKASECLRLIDLLGDRVDFYKVGLEAVVSGFGLELARELKESGKKVLLDLKLHDIPNTVERAARAAAIMGVDFLTVHAYPQTMAAAGRGCEFGNTRVLGVTVLTSMELSDLYDAGYDRHLPRVDVLVVQRAGQAKEANVAGIVCSPSEAFLIRRLYPPMVLVVPGIRPASAAGDVQDQRRVGTPGQAISDGADYLVVGRPITQAQDPVVAAEAILKEMAEVDQH